MDNLTHTLVGVALSRGFFKKRLALATTAMVFAANAPDLDILAGWSGTRYLQYHRGVLHSLLALPFWAILIAIGIRLIAKWRKLPLPSWWLAILLGLVGVGSHLLLDYTNAYGIRLLAPFNERWYALDISPIVDPWLWVMLAACLGLPMVLGLVGAEVGAKANPHRFSALLALSLMAVWWGVRYQAHQTALQLLGGQDAASFFDGQQPLDWGAFPLINTPFQWQGVVDLPNRYLVARIDTPLSSDGDLVTPLRNYLKPPLDPAIQQAETTTTGRVFLWFARDPLADVATLGNQTRVTITDLRFADGARRPGMHAAVTLNAAGKVVAQGFGWE